MISPNKECYDSVYKLHVTLCPVTLRKQILCKFIIYLMYNVLEPTWIQKFKIKIVILWIKKKGSSHYKITTKIYGALWSYI